MWSEKDNDKNCYQIWDTLYTVDAQLTGIKMMMTHFCHQ